MSHTEFVFCKYYNSMLNFKLTEKKPVRPLSANRRTPDKSSTDTDFEASAVLAALREENEKAVNYNSKDGKKV